MPVCGLAISEALPAPAVWQWCTQLPQTPRVAFAVSSGQLDMEDLTALAMGDVLLPEPLEEPHTNGKGAAHGSEEADEDDELDIMSESDARREERVVVSSLAVIAGRQACPATPSPPGTLSIFVGRTEPALLAPCRSSSWCPTSLRAASSARPGPTSRRFRPSPTPGCRCGGVRGAGGRRGAARPQRMTD